MHNVNNAVNSGRYVLSATPCVNMNELWNATFNANKQTSRIWTLAGMSQPLILICVYGSQSFGCAIIHNGLWAGVKLNYLFCCFKKNSLWHVKSIFLTHFWTLVNKTRKNFVYIVVLHVKLQTQRTKIVEMRGKSFLWIKICCFTPQFLPSDYFFVQDPASNSGIEERNHLQGKFIWQHNFNLS